MCRYLPIYADNGKHPLEITFHLCYFYWYGRFLPVIQNRNQAKGESCLPTICLKNLKPKHSGCRFGVWAELIRSALVWARAGDPLGSWPTSLVAAAHYIKRLYSCV